MADGKNTSGGIGFFGLLTIVFIVLKLVGTITWSLVWVLAPFWGPLAVAIVILAIAGIFVALDK